MVETSANLPRVLMACQRWALQEVRATSTPATNIRNAAERLDHALKTLDDIADQVAVMRLTLPLNLPDSETEPHV